MNNLLRSGKGIVKRALGKLPQPEERLTGKLAREGGRPVRRTDYRPWPRYPADTIGDWINPVGSVLRQMFLDGAEGIPQKLSREFGQKFAGYCGAAHGLLLPHGTDALRFALAAAIDHDGLDYGGEVIVPNLSFVASATAALDRRLGVVFVDVDASTLNIDPAAVERAIVPGKTRAIVPVHLFGQPANMGALMDLARKHKLKVIEDAAQAHGAVHELGRVGAIGDAGAFSFQAFKNLSSGEGGCLTTNSEEIFERAYMLHNAGRPAGGARWGHAALGWNCRPSEYVAAVLLHRLRRLEVEQQLRAKNMAILREALSDIACVEPLGIGRGVVRHGVHMFVMRYHADHCAGLRIADFLNAVNSEGVPLGRAYDMTLSRQPAMLNLAEKRPEFVRTTDTPVADAAVKEMVYVPHPLFLGNSDDMHEIAAALRKVQRHFAPDAVRSTGVDRGAAETLSTDSATTQITESGAQAGGDQAIRTGIIGSGLMGIQHAEVVSSHPGMTVSGFADVRIENARNAADRFGGECYETADAMIQSGEVDCVVVATPHWQHGELSAAALDRGIHVLCEKPLTVTVSDADRLLEAAARSSSMFGVVHQTRFHPVYRYVKQLLESGELGEIQRCSMVETAWRTEAYYRSSPWRGTWSGEGGGVLLNQAPHLLDRFAWLCGMPTQVNAKCDTRLHQIEVEDTVSALFQYRNGAHGYVHINTTESPAISQTVISCDRGRIEINNGAVTVSRLRASLKDKTANDSRLFGELQAEIRDVPFPPRVALQDMLRAFYDDFVEAVHGNGNKTLTCDGREGIHAVELANAMILSSHEGGPVSLPLDRARYDAFIQSKTQSSRLEPVS